MCFELLKVCACVYRSKTNLINKKAKIAIHRAEALSLSDAIFLHSGWSEGKTQEQLKNNLRRVRRTDPERVSLPPYLRPPAIASVPRRNSSPLRRYCSWGDPWRLRRSLLRSAKHKLCILQNTFSIAIHTLLFKAQGQQGMLFILASLHEPRLCLFDQKLYKSSILLQFIIT